MAEKKPKFTDEQYKSMEIVTGRFILSYPHLRTKGMYQGKETNYNFTMLFKKDTDLTELRKRLTRAKVLNWGADQKKWPKMYANPIEDGDKATKKDGSADEGKAGYWVVKATSTKPIIPLDKGGNEIMSDADAYAGSICRAHLSASVYELSKTNIGVKFYCKGLQKLAEGERLGNGGNSKAAFASTPDEGSEGENDMENYDDTPEEDSGF